MVIYAEDANGWLLRKCASSVHDSCQCFLTLARCRKARTFQRRKPSTNKRIRDAASGQYPKGVAGMFHHRSLRTIRFPKYHAVVQRLYSAFPAGAPGWALLLLRASIAGLFLSVYSARSITGWSGVLFLFEILLAVVLCAGVFVPVMTTLLCILQVWLIYGDVDQRHACECFLVVETIALGLLGPGAYSFDSQRFGRRVLKLAEKDF
jgi:uncharacterized membrane protein YhdT